MIAVIGSGGKSTTLKSIALLLSAKRKICCFTTTRMAASQLDFADKSYDSFQSFFADPSPPNISAVYTPDPMHVKTPFQLSDFPLFNNSEILFVYEADGAKMLPLKFHKNDPVFLPQTTHVISVIGLKCLFQPLKDVCFRSELFIQKYNQNKQQINGEQIVGLEEIEFARKEYISQWDRWDGEWRNFDYKFESKNENVVVVNVFNQIDVVEKRVVDELREKYTRDAFGQEEIVQIVDKWF
ncbi:Putative_selenium-dependent hydroxylase accessory protein [Hexamita inflata]|uniref:Selenium-dependent hydroxylase accessory protein n=1 Tax=Hexamita inflata TaxID=28002 RepID=A0AA86PAH6_9EUKA|nr:Putative selenium-dependent hydroxylase accessory protein [Hexamita inflata]